MDNYQAHTQCKSNILYAGFTLNPSSKNKIDASSDTSEAVTSYLSLMMKIWEFMKLVTLSTHTMMMENCVQNTNNIPITNHSGCPLIVSRVLIEYAIRFVM